MESREKISGDWIVFLLTDSPISVLADQSNVPVGSAPSSSDSSSADEKRLPQPIGAGRSVRKIANQTGPSDGASQHGWGFPSGLYLWEFVPNAYWLTPRLTTVSTQRMI